MSRVPQQSSETESGQAIVLLALAAIGLLAFVALAIDGGNALTERRRAQNAADAGALAGARTLWLQRTASNEFETPVLQAINTAAEANGIEDTDGAAGNHVNGNVEAFYTDRDGNVLPGASEVGALGVIPPAAQGVRVVARRDFGSFIANIIGRARLAADADATAVYIPPTGCGDYAIYASCTGDCKQNALKATGSGITINGGGIHSNADILISGGGQGIGINDGFIEYGTECNGCDKKITTNNGAVPTQVEPFDRGSLWDLEDFQPGGSAAVLAGGQYHYVNGDLDELSGDGLYYVTGDIQLHAPVGNVTLVAEGEIKLSGSANIHTFNQQWPLLFSNSSDTSPGAIDISGSDAQWTGFLYAPNGLVSMSNASNSTMSGAIFAHEVNLSGASIFINYDPAYCPPMRARVILLK
ncbi:MAG TPA: pilus assembly protein TadG-related protein [Anaerolineae bacterium]